MQETLQCFVKPQLIFLVLFLCLPIQSHALTLQPILLDNTYADIEGRSALITCIDEQRKPNSYLRWTKYDSRVIGSDNPRISAKTVGGDNEKLGLFVTEIQRSDAGDYYCELVEKESNILLERILLKFVVYTELVFQGPKKVDAAESQSCTIMCQILPDNNIKSLSFTWYKNHSKLAEKKNNTRYAMTKKNNIGSFLTIKNVTRQDAGVYQCEAAAVYDLKFQIAAWDIILDVQYPPSFPPTPSKTTEVWLPVNRNISDIVNITCSVDANPKASYKWENMNTHTVNRGTLGDQFVDIVSEDNRSILRLNMKDLKPNPGLDSVPVTKFVCRAHSVIGSDYQIFQIRQGNFPSPPVIVSSEIRGKELILVITQNTSVIPPVDYYKIEMQGTNFAIVFNATQTNLNSIPSESNNVTYRVPLTTVPSGSHKFSVVAHNPVGWSPPVDDPKFEFIISGASVVESFSYLMLLSIVLTLFENRVYFL